MQIATRSPSDLQQLAIEIHQGRVFAIWPSEADHSLYMLVFASLAFLSAKELRQLIQHAGLFYEYLNRAVPGASIHGHPIFFSVQALTHVDTLIVRQHLKELGHVTSVAHP